MDYKNVTKQFVYDTGTKTRFEITEVPEFELNIKPVHLLILLLNLNIIFFTNHTLYIMLFLEFKNS